MKSIMGIRKLILGVILMAMVFGTAFAAMPAQAASSDTFKVTVVHGIDGRKLGLSKALPVNIEVWKDGAVLAYINDFKYKDRFQADLPAGKYQIRVYSQELKAYVQSMNLGPVNIGAGADLLIRAQLKNKTNPILFVKSR